MSDISKNFNEVGLLTRALAAGEATAEQTAEAINALVSNLGKTHLIITANFAPNQEAAARLEELENLLEVIKPVSTDEQLKVLNDNLAGAKKFIKRIEKEALDLRAPANELSKKIIKQEKDFLSNLGELVAKGEKAILAYAKLQEERAKKQREENERQAREEAYRVKRINEMILKVENNIIEALANTKLSEIDDKINKLEGLSFKSEVYQEFLPTIEALIPKYVEKFKELKSDLERNGGASNIVEEAKQEAETQAFEREASAAENIQMTKEFYDSQAPAAKGVQKKWKLSRVVDLKKVPYEYLTVDEKKVSEAIKAGKYEIPGLLIEHVSHVVNR